MGSLRSLSKQKIPAARFEIRKHGNQIACVDWITVANEDRKKALIQVRNSECLGSYNNIINIPVRYDDVEVFTWDTYGPSKAWRCSNLKTIRHIKDVEIFLRDF
jgi:hypothetical protein